MATATKTKTNPKKTVFKDERPLPKNKARRKEENFGVVAYTKGSRFTDAQVKAAVERVLGKH